MQLCDCLSSKHKMDLCPPCTSLQSTLSRIQPSALVTGCWGCCLPALSQGPLKPRQLLTQSNATLRHKVGALAAAARRVVTLLPDRDVNEVMIVMMPHVTRVPTEILVQQVGVGSCCILLLEF